MCSLKLSVLWALIALASCQSTTLSEDIDSSYMIRLESVYPALQRYIGNLGPTWSNLTRQDKGQKIVNFLKSETKKAQAPFLQFLKDELKLDQRLVSTFWLFNTIKIANVSENVLKLLKFARIPGVIEIEKEIEIQAITETNREFQNHTTPHVSRMQVQQNIEKIGAPEVWNDGTRGRSILVGIIDSGVRVTHNCLKNNYAGNHGHPAAWYDATDPPNNLPVDNLGLGTHAIGIAVGKCGIGAAPDAHFIACRAYVHSTGTESAFIRCLQYMTCPTRRGDEEELCGKLPNVVTNSWGIIGDHRQFNDLITAWSEANILGVFAIGNGGPGCNSGASPGNQRDFFSVGETNNYNILTTTSGRGPGVDGSTKPTLVAPGKAIESAWHTSDSALFITSGTGQATPAVAGGAALLMSYYYGFYNLESTKRLIIEKGVQNNVKFIKGSYCGGNANTVNNAYGHGQFDVAKAYKALKSGYFK